MTSTNRIAVVGGGPAGIYTADILTKSDPDVIVDIIEKLPTPFGLVRYGVAPDHPRIKEIIKALHRVFHSDRINFYGNVEFGTAVTLVELTERYRAVIFSTGADTDNPLNLPGGDKPGVFGASDFVDWYDAHPDADTSWPLTAESVAIIGAGNVALDISRMLAKPVEEQLGTEIPAHVQAGLAVNKARDIHIFARRGPAHVKFTPVELRELSHSPSVDVLVEPEGFEIDSHGQEHLAKSKASRLVADTLYKYLDNEPTDATRRIHIHLCQQPVEILGDGTITGLKTERTRYQPDGSVAGTGEFVETPVQAVYQAIGYRSQPLPDLPFDADRGLIPNHEGRVTDADGATIPGLYATGWSKRGAIGLIGHTKSCASETIKHLLNDLPDLPEPAKGDNSLAELLTSREQNFVTWDGWLRIDETEKALGEKDGRERIKLATWAEMLAAADVSTSVAEPKLG